MRKQKNKIGLSYKYVDPKKIKKVEISPKLFDVSVIIKLSECHAIYIKMFQIEATVYNTLLYFFFKTKAIIQTLNSKQTLPTLKNKTT